MDERCAAPDGPRHRTNEASTANSVSDGGILRVRGGMADAKAGRPPYFWALLSTPSQRISLLKSGWKHVGKVFIFAVLLDVVYQIIELHFVYMGQAIIVPIILFILPYLFSVGWSGARLKGLRLVVSGTIRGHSRVLGNRNLGRKPNADKHYECC